MIQDGKNTNATFYWECGLSSMKLSPEDIENGELIVEKMERNFYNRLYLNKVQSSEET